MIGQALLLTLLLTISSATAYGTDCHSSPSAALPRSSRWDLFHLRRAGSTQQVLALSRPSPTNSPPAWRLLTRNRASGQLCVEKSGNGVAVLHNIHDFKSDQRFGMPGSGHPRCSAPDPLSGMHVRIWANKELGDSLIFSTESAQQDAVTLLISRLDGQWILLSRTKQGTCYLDRGDDFAPEQIAALSR